MKRRLTVLGVVVGNALVGGNDSQKPRHLTDQVLKEFAGIPHVKSVYPFLEVPIILLFEKGKILPDKRIRLNMGRGKETEVKMGEKIAVRM